MKWQLPVGNFHSHVPKLDAHNTLGQVPSPWAPSPEIWTPYSAGPTDLHL